MSVQVEKSRTSVVGGRRDLPSGRQEKHPPWGSMMGGDRNHEGGGSSSLKVPNCGVRCTHMP